MFWWYGSPWAKIVDSRATTGRPAPRASETSGRLWSSDDGNDVDVDDDNESGDDKNDDSDSNEGDEVNNFLVVEL